ncbi:MAG: AAA family ATPase [Rhodovibrionaceae bacterium]
MPFDELLEWAASENRPVWQRDALRRLAENGELTDDDLSELRRLIEFEEGLAAEELPAPVPLAAEHLTEAASDAPRTVLASLGPVANVDRLEARQPAMRFAVNGVTLVYGPNASGKSGYCRITKQLCGSLSTRALRGNVYDEAQPPPAEVGLAYRVGGEDQQKAELTWIGNTAPPPELARISVFDTASATVYVDKERKIEFLPYELDILNKLGLAARALDEGFRARADALNAAIAAPLPAGYRQGTTACRVIERLVPETALADLPSEQELRDLANWTDADQAELDALVEQSRYEPATLLRLRREERQALQTLLDDIRSIGTTLGDPAIAALSEMQQDAVAKNAAAEASAHDLFKDEPIPNVGSEVWRQMLRYAREFSVEVFPKHSPPQIATAAQCVLCQQDLTEEAATRLAAFDAYIGERVAEAAATAREAFDIATAAVQNFAVKTRVAVAGMLEGYAALSDAQKANAETIAAYFEKASERHSTVKRILDEQTYDQLEALESLPDSPAPLVEGKIAALDVDIEELGHIKQDDQAAQRRADRQAELTDRKKLSEEIDFVVARRDQLEERHRVAACRAQCRLTAITRQITERRRDILTPTLKNALEDELKALHLTHIPLNLADRGDLGDSIVEIALSAQQRIANNSDVLSEGEQRGLALACFLAELSEIGRDHGIIVDDPVSSLDHSRMEAVARRLAEEAAKGRQVIVFTHNILFHYMLSTEARRTGVACHEEWMSNLGNDRFGIIDAGRKPWHMKPVTERLNDIDLERKELADAGYDRNNEGFRSGVTDLYTKMRMTWERIVEEILFNKVVQRFRPEIMTQSLRAACFDPENDYPAIFEGMKRTSHYSGHDLAADMPGELPARDDIDRDIDALKVFADHARNRKKTLEKQDVYEKGVEPVLL